MMFDLMREYAVKTVWCSPDQDNQVILAAQRITAKGGRIVSVPLMTRRYALPQSDKYYHVFKIGQAHPTLLGLLPNNPEWGIGSWIKFSEAVNQLPVFCDLYTDKGVHVPFHQSYYMYTEDRALVFCVEINKKLPIQFDLEQIYLRCYTNAYYQSTESNGLSRLTQCYGTTITSNNNILELQNTLAAWRQRPGALFCYRNGNLKERLDFTTVEIGDVVEVLYDASVKRMVTLQVKDLYSFASIRDDQNKYLFHYPETTDQQIDYVDDIDVYILNKNTGQLEGRYLHRNQKEALRMVTYRDYSVSVDIFKVIADDLVRQLTTLSLDIRDFYLRLYIRHSGLTRPLVFEHARLFELYKLPDEKVQAALLGVDATVSFWSAPVLENSPFIRLLNEPYRNIDIPLVEQAFGYNAIAKYLGDTPTRPLENQGIYPMFKLSPGLIENSTVYEYDAEGSLLERHYNRYSELYIARNPACALIEAVSGEGKEAPDVVYGTTNLLLPGVYSYRVYKCYKVDDVPTEDWQDITGSNEYTLEGGRLVWLTQETDHWLMLRSDRTFLAYELSLNLIAGTLYFDLSEISGGVHRRLALPLGDLDLWLNGKVLIRDLDYFVQFPRVYIVNKEYLIQPSGSTPQKIEVRFTGFAENRNGTLSMRAVEDFGFIEHGVLSNNRRFDIRDDKVLQISVKGQLKHRQDLVFSEEHEGISILNATNGRPYQIKERIVPLKQMTAENTYRLRKLSLERDQVVSDYLSLKLPQPPRTPISAMISRHILVSPFISHLVNDLNSGQFTLSSIEKELTDQEIFTLCRPYESLLAFDPISTERGVDQRFVLIHPHALNATVRLDLYSYAFIKRVIKLYGRGLVTLAQHITLKVGEP